MSENCELDIIDETVLRYGYPRLFRDLEEAKTATGSYAWLKQIPEKRKKVLRGLYEQIEFTLHPPVYD